jgi:Fur family ferric uptake transcriptional regulator
MRKTQENWPEGLKRTQPRERVLTVLEQADHPLSAMDICSAAEQGGKPVWLSTVYRILELFVQKGVVTKVAMMHNDMTLYELNHLQHRHYAVCVSCRKVVPLHTCPLEKFMPRLDDQSFHVLGHNLEIYGYCGECERRMISLSSGFS